ncbi:uncharacterized protein LOC117336701 [Pecten maximus]|uniref:uncharacterized protein LOC117336701 n=1 Tax=Pecten maximus TaxID=6579 RepID=UPI001458E3DA|nr:uncharacterized protein LOC117336701 [Pecten maximus]
MVGFMENTLTSEEDIELEVVTTNTRREPASLNITLHSGQIEEVVLEERSFRIHNIAAALLNIDSKKSFKGIRVDSNATISVVGVNRVKTDSQNSMDLFAGVEYSSLGAQYFAVTSYHSSEILIIGTTDNTRVTVALRTDSKYVVYEGTNYENADIINETVDEFNTIQIQSAGDLTGTKITATHPISVFSGNKWFGFESGSRKGSYLVEQLLPLEQWGTRYVAVPPEEFSYVFKIVACADDTEIYLTCAEANSDPLILKESGDFYMSDELNHACVITSSKQFLVAMITSHISDKDPSLIIAQPMETLLADVFLYVPTSFQSAELMLITTENQSLPILDPQPLGVEFFSIDEEFFGMRIRVSEGVSVLAAPQSYMHVSGYLHGTRYFGWGFESFGYPLLPNDFQDLTFFGYGKYQFQVLFTQENGYKPKKQIFFGNFVQVKQQLISSAVNN